MAKTAKNWDPTYEESLITSTPFEGSPTHPQAPRYAKWRVEDAEKRLAGAKDELATARRTFHRTQSTGTVEAAERAVASAKLELAGAREFQIKSNSKENRAAQHAFVEAIHRRWESQRLAREEHARVAALAYEMHCEAFEMAGLSGLAGALRRYAKKPGNHWLDIAHTLTDIVRGGGY